MKHAGEPRNPRTGAVPQFGKAVAVQDGPDSTWRLTLPIEHQGRILDGYAFAGEAPCGDGTARTTLVEWFRRLAWLRR